MRGDKEEKNELSDTLKNVVDERVKDSEVSMHVLLFR